MLLKTFAERILFPDTIVDEKRLKQLIKGKTIVITGASFGIGEQLAVLFSDYNVRLVLIARTEPKLKQLSKTLSAHGSQCRFIAADLYQESEVDRVIQELKMLPEGIDIFISNAGKSINRSLIQSLSRYHDFTRTNSLNYLAPVKLLLAITPILAAQKGQVINVSAINVLLLPAPGWAAYQASKTAFDQWFRANFAEWKMMGIHAKTIYLPLVRTGMITPNNKYTTYPAMQPEQAAIRIARLICSPNNYCKPWWLIFGQVVNFIGRPLWEMLTYTYLKKR